MTELTERYPAINEHPEDFCGLMRLPTVGASRARHLCSARRRGPHESSWRQVSRPPTGQADDWVRGVALVRDRGRPASRLVATAWRERGRSGRDRSDRGVARDTRRRLSTRRPHGASAIHRPSRDATSRTTSSGPTPAPRPELDGSDVANQIHDPALGVDLQEDVVPSRLIDLSQTLVSVSRE